MFRVYGGVNKEYASAAICYYKNGKKVTDYFYLGKVIDDENNVFFNNDRGFFVFDFKTGDINTPLKQYKLPTENKEKKNPEPLDFGDAYFLYSYMIKNGFMTLIESIKCSNNDLLKCLIIYSSISKGAYSDFHSWYNASIIKYLFSDLDVSGQKISKILYEIGRDNQDLSFQKIYIDYLVNRCDLSNNILIDSTGLKNDINVYLTKKRNNNGKIDNETRLILVADANTGMPIFYKIIPGNVVDITTLTRTVLELREHNVRINLCIIDCGYNSIENLESFYDEDGNIETHYITRVKSNNKQFTDALSENPINIFDKNYLYRCGGKYYSIKEKEIKIGKNKDKVAYLYYGIDIYRFCYEVINTLTKKESSYIEIGKISEQINSVGYFCLISSKHYDKEIIIPTYNKRLSIEQTFDIAKNYTKLLPLRVHNEYTLKGHILVSYIATCIIKSIKLGLNTYSLSLGNKVNNLRYIKCNKYNNNIVTSIPTKGDVNIFNSFSIDFPKKLEFKNDKLVLPIIEEEHTPIWVKNIKSHQIVSLENPLPSKKRRKRTQKEDAIFDVDDEFSINLDKNQESETEYSRDVDCRVSSEESYLDDQVYLGDDTSKTQEQTDFPQSVQGYTEIVSEQLSMEKRGPGRPLGSKNKKTLEREALLREQGFGSNEQKPKRGPGRPLGSKNKKTLEREALLREQGFDPN